MVVCTESALLHVVKMCPIGKRDEGKAYVVTGLYIMTALGDEYVYKMTASEVYEAINYAKAGTAFRVDSKDRYCAIRTLDDVRKNDMYVITFEELRDLKNAVGHSM